MDSAMIRGIAILALTLLVIAWVPWTGPVILILTPLPLVYTFQELGRKKGGLALGAAYILVLGGFQLLDIPRPLAVFLIGLGGALFAEVLRRRYAFDKTVWVASLALFLSVFGLLEGYALANGTSIGSLVGDYFEALITDNIELYRQMNFSPEQLKLIEANKSQITGFIVGIFPSLVLNGMILTVWLNILIGRLLFGGKADSWFVFGDLSLWKAPEKLIWLAILAGALILLAPGNLPLMIGMNIVILCSLLYFFQGLAIATFLFKARRVPVALRWVFYILLAIQQYLAILVIAVGLFDLWVDFRRRIGKIDSQA